MRARSGWLKLWKLDDSRTSHFLVLCPIKTCKHNYIFQTYGMSGVGAIMLGYIVI